MEILKKDIEKAIELLKMPYKREMEFSQYDCSFIYGTENQKEINKIIDYKNKKVCTVASSGDQYISAIYYGADDVTVYDVNRLTYYITSLKVVSIMHLSYGEYIEFFMPLKNKELKKTFWDSKTFERLFPFMPNDVAVFWDHVINAINKYGYGNFIVPDSDLHYEEVILQGMPFFASEKEYYVLQNLLRSKGIPRFVEADILEFSKYFKNDKFDVIYLSNIIECLVIERVMKAFPYYDLENRVEEELLVEIWKQIGDSLNEKGIVLMDYRRNKGIDDSTDILFNNEYFDVKEVPAKFPIDPNEYYGYSNTDLVLTYEPSRKGYYI